MMNPPAVTHFVWFTLLLSLTICETINSAKLNTSNSNQSVEHLRITTKDSDICKKCQCDLQQYILDCSNRSITTWFTEDDWEALQYGDVLFKTIRLEHNSLENVPIFPKMAVEHLYLNFNKITKIEKKAFMNLQNLTVLNLSHNQITSKAMVPEIFEGPFSASEYEPLENLEELDLGYNLLHTLDPDLFEHIPHLKTLILGSNTFKIIDKLTETAIASSTNLKTLDLSYMELSDLPEHMLHSPRDIETLMLTGNLLRKIPESLTYATNLKNINLDENPMDNLGDKNIFPELSNLKILSISYMSNLSAIGAGSFSKLQSLQEVLISNNPKLSYIHPNAFARPTLSDGLFDYPPIEKMYLHDNNLTILEKKLLERWDKVRVIDIRRNPWRCDCENNWLIDSLLTQIKQNQEILENDVKCSTPIEWAGVEISELNEKGKILPCINEYNHNSYYDGGVLMGLLIGLLLGIPFSFAVFFMYKRGCFGILGRYGSNDNNRALYNRANFQDDYHI